MPGKRYSDQLKIKLLVYKIMLKVSVILKKNMKLLELHV
jgi:hypothetical protein